jgi:Protein of unknown function (DUF1517)
MGIGEQFNKFTGKTRYVVTQIFLHLASEDVTPLIGILNEAGRQTIEADGDLTIAGECLAEVCQNLMQYDTYWRSVHNTGEVMWSEGDATGFFNELFTDAAQRYLAEPGPNSKPETELTLPPTPNLVVMMTIIFSGEEPAIENNLSQMDSLRAALKAIINLHTADRIEAMQIHFSPNQLGDQLSDEQITDNFPELLPL